MERTMNTLPAPERFDRLDEKVDIDEYNFEHFGTRHLLRDGRRTLTRSGIAPGDPAPDFELPRADGGTLRLSNLRGKPVLLRFGSLT
jgi:hypothetical protein